MIETKDIIGICQRCGVKNKRKVGSIHLNCKGRPMTLLQSLRLHLLKEYNTQQQIKD
jgi:hypothetical protein